MTKNEVIAKAVKWWANKISSKVPHSNGDKSESSIFACMLADMQASNVTEEQIVTFEKSLSDQLSIIYDKDLNSYGKAHITIGCDYHPDAVLYDAAQAANIGELNFPFKTWMHIYPTKVEVKDGYGKDFVEI